jgi:hypothetical protein
VSTTDQVPAAPVAQAPERGVDDLPQYVTNVTGLRCRECGETEPLGASHVCGFCFGPLEVVYDYDAIAAGITPAEIAGGPPSMWR